MQVVQGSPPSNLPPLHHWPPVSDMQRPPLQRGAGEYGVRTRVGFTIDAMYGDSPVGHLWCSMFLRYGRGAGVS